MIKAVVSEVQLLEAGKNRRIAVSMVGIKVNGEELDWEETLALIERHLQAAHATAELRALRAG